MILAAVILLASCARVTDYVVEPVRVMWGSSTRALEKARGDALKETCPYGYAQCFDDVLAIARKQEWTVFIQDHKQRHIIILGIQGSVNTTEVGIFFSAVKENSVTVEVTSLSSPTKKTVADILFNGLTDLHLNTASKIDPQ